MIPFFRKIPKKLADDNQFFKYSRYAIGEIALVVVGILIALYINNWNEERKNSQLKFTYLETLSIDIKRDIENLEAWNLRNDEAEIEGLYMLDFIQGKLHEIDSTRLVMSFLLCQYKPVISLSLSTYNDLINSGNIKVFKDIELKKLLDEYYAQDNWRLKLDDRITQTIWYDYRNKITEFVDPMIFNDMYQSNFSDDLRTNDLLDYKIDWELIKNSPDLIKELKNVLAYRVVIRKFYLNNQIEKSRNLHEIILNKNTFNNTD